MKTPSQRFTEFARDKANLFDRCCAADKIDTLEQLKELILLEEFKNCLSEKIVVYLNEQKVSSLSEAAVFSDEFVLTHRVVFSPVKHNVSSRVGTSKDAAVVYKNTIQIQYKLSSDELYLSHTQLYRV